MGEVRYTADPSLNDRVSPLIDQLKQGLVTSFHPKSIILSGSFGRGEATVTDQNGQLAFLSDCEITIIPYKYLLNRRKVDRFAQDFYGKTGLKVEIWGAIPTLYLLTPFLSKKLKPSIGNYDLKYGSRVIYGKDYLQRILEFKAEDIPLWEGIRLLLNRMIEALESFSPGNPSRETLFWTDKIVLACQDALLLSLGKYSPSYQQRNKILLQVFPDHFNGIDGINRLPRMAKEATARKLFGVTNSASTEYWFEVAGLCDIIFRYIVREGLGIDFEDYTDFHRKYLTTFSRSGRVYSFMKNARNLLKQVTVHPGQLHPLKPAFRFPWVHVVYSIIPLVYFGLTAEGVNERYLKHGADIISRFDRTITVGTCSLEEWQKLKKRTAYLWRRICW